jgi:hypothetical protein
MSRFVSAQLIRLKSFSNKILPKKLSRYHYRAFFVFLLVSFFLGLTSIVSAQSLDAGDWLIRSASSIVLSLSELAIGLSIFFLRFFVTLASYNNYIDVSVVKLGWVMVRDIANMFFVVALLVIAFATILGVEKYEWKKSLVKIVIMAILINFSNLIAQIIIDAAHVFTITFLNAISASAGGNLINMFNLEKVNSLVQGADMGADTSAASSAVFAGAVISLIFAVMTAVSLGSYAVVMAMRVVVLWALIILSPLAYLLSAMPKGEEYAARWWKEFTKHVIVAPVMVFFLWLAFATLGTGQIMSEIQSDNAIRLQQGTDPVSISIAKVSTWENMANYIVGVIFLYIGLQMTKDSGVTGAGFVGSAMDLGKKAIAYGTGYAIAKSIAQGGKEHFKKSTGGLVKDYASLLSGKLGLKKMPVFGSQSRGALRRKDALKKMDAYYEDRKDRIMAEGGGFAAKLGVSKGTRAKEIVNKDIAKRTEDAEMKKLTGGERMGRIKAEEKNVKSLNKLFHFSDEEAYLLYQTVSLIEKSSAVKEKLIKKLHTLYDLKRWPLRKITKK